MAKIEISQEDKEFLKELQNELNTQPNDGNADPVYWGILETREVGVPDGCGEAKIYFGDGGYGDTEEACRLVEEYLEESNSQEIKAWKEVDKNDMNEIIDFVQNYYGWKDWRIVYVDSKESIATDTGMFLTKRACKEYIEKYGYNLSHPKTYAMTAYRNKEYETLLRIIRTMKID